ncbi:MAG: zinc ribbon domain-containing protein [Anaerolineales bacterium]|nr:zinc ribbon domain-containing protein [Anaerolineales bacterium]
MTTRTFHGKITPNDIARALVGEFNRNHLIARRSGDGRHVVVQIGTRPARGSGGQTALTVNLRSVEDGVAVQIGKQAWFGIFASLGVTALTMLRNPFAVIGRLDDIAADIDSMQLAEKVVEVIEETVKLAGASHQISERLRRLSCEYCGTANAVGQPDCIACGAPLGDVHPTACSNCGFIVNPRDKTCPNCGYRLK